MSYQVLARKWRPKRFADLVGQEHVVRALSNALGDSRLHHAYLLTGTRGVGKTTIARILAKSLNCEQGVSAEPCGVCAACSQIDTGRFVDLLEIDAASNTGIDNIREVLENAQYAPTAGRFKVYIIDEVHMLSKSAFNAMLKTLEEPPAHVKFILATTDPQKVPVTVLSRCLQFSLRNMTPQQVAGHLAHVLDQESIAYQPAALALLARAAAGSMRDALSLLDQAIAYGVGQVEEAGVRAMLGAVDRRYLLSLLGHLAAGDGEALLKEAESLAAHGIGFEAALGELAMLLQQIALAQTVPAALADDEPERDVLLALADALTAEDVQLYYQIALHGRRDLSLAPDEHAGFLMTLLRMLAFRPVDAETRAVTPPAATPAPASANRAEAARALLARNQHKETVAPAPVETPVEVVPEEAAAPEVVAETITPPEPEVAPQPAMLLAEPEPEPEPEFEPVLEPVPEPVFEPDPEPAPPVTGQPSIIMNGDDWLQLVQQLGPQLGAAQMLASSAVLHEQHDNRWLLLLEPSLKQFLKRDLVEKLRSVLSTHFGQELHIEVRLTEHDSETPQMGRERIRGEQLQAARDALDQDPAVQALQMEFGAVLLPDTIQPLTEE